MSEPSPSLIPGPHPPNARRAGSAGPDVVVDVAVVGAGLAGLAAAATAARAGLRVVVIDPHPPGGRARTSEVGGYRFNLGPRALFLAAAGRAVLGRLGLDPPGGPPALAQGCGSVGDQLHILPTSAEGLAGTGLLDADGRARYGQLMGRLVPGLDAAAHADRSTASWLEGLDLRADVDAMVRALIRLSTYAADLDALPADVAISQLQLPPQDGARVRYVDGGWQRLVDHLLAVAVDGGAELRRGAAVAVTSAPDHQLVHLGGFHPPAGFDETRSGSADDPLEADGGRSAASADRPSRGSGHPPDPVAARAVVLALGSPEAAAALLPEPPAWPRGPAVAAACLDLGLRRPPRPPFVVGIDEPLYLSTHCPPADLAPAGGAVVHVMRYLTGADDGRRAADLRAELAGLAARAGISDDDVVAQRFLRRMVVVSALPPLGRGLAGRPAVEASGQPGVFLAGDWVGPVGFLADGSLASGEAAGRAAAGHLARQPSAAGRAG